MVKVCRACLETVEGAPYFYIDTFDNTEIDSTIPKDVLLLCVPEMDLYISEQPGICASCLNMFESFSQFKNKCLATEDKILSYLKRNNVGGHMKVDLSKVVSGEEPESSRALAQLEEIGEVDLIKLVPDSPQEEEPPDDSQSLLFSCNQCPFFTMDKDKLLGHKCLPTPQEKYKCEYCDYATNRRYRLGYHVNAKHTKSNWYYCDQCDHKTTDSGSLKRHQKVVHVAFDATTKVYSCNSCNFKSASQLACQRHKTAKHGPPINVCQICNYQTRDKSNFRKHTFIHGDKPRKCTKCSYQCVSPYQLQRHFKKCHS